MANDRMQDPYIQELVGEFQNKNKPVSETIRERLKKQVNDSMPLIILQIL